MQTLNYGYEKPETGDSGSIWFPAMERNVQRINDHTHDGTDSAKLDGSAIAPGTQSILAAGWVATTGGTYRQNIAMPAGYTFGNCFIAFILTASDIQTFPKVEKIDNTHFYVYTNDPTLDYKAIYVS